MRRLASLFCALCDALAIAPLAAVFFLSTCAEQVEGNPAARLKNFSH